MHTDYGQKGENIMMKKILRKKMRAIPVVLVIAVLLVAMLAQPVSQAVSYKASFIQEYTGDLKVNYKDFLDSSVMQKLPDTIQPDDEISVIIARDEQNLLDAYEATDKAMSFTQFALESEEAANIISKRDSRKAQILSSLDKAGVVYAAGEEYSAAPPLRVSHMSRVGISCWRGRSPSRR